MIKEGSMPTISLFILKVLCNLAQLTSFPFRDAFTNVYVWLLKNCYICAPISLALSQFVPKYGGAVIPVDIRMSSIVSGNE